MLEMKSSEKIFCFTFTLPDYVAHESPKELLEKSEKYTVWKYESWFP